MYKKKNTGTAVKNSENGTFDLNSNSTIVNTMADGTAIINEESGVFTVKSGTQPTISGKGKGISNSATFHYNGNGTVTGDTDNGIDNGSTGVLNVTGGVDVTRMQKPGIRNAGTATISGKKQRYGVPAKRHCPTVRPAPVPSAERLSSSIRMMRSQR